MTNCNHSYNNLLHTLVGVMQVLQNSEVLEYIFFPLLETSLSCPLPHSGDTRIVLTSPPLNHCRAGALWLQTPLDIIPSNDFHKHWLGKRFRTTGPSALCCLSKGSDVSKSFQEEGLQDISSKVPGLRSGMQSIHL